MTKLQTAQKKAIRIAYGAKYNGHCDPICARIKVLKLEDQYELCVAKFALPIIDGYAPTGVSEVFRIQEAHLDQCTRGSQNSDKQLFVPTCKTEAMKRLPQYNVPSIWNNKLPDYIKHQGKTLMITNYKMNKFIEYEHFNCQKTNCRSC